MALAEIAQTVVRLSGGRGELGMVVRGGGVIVAMRLLAAALTYLSTLVLARWLGAAEFGRYSYAFAWLGVLAFPTGLGFAPLIVRFLPAYAAARDWARVRGLLTRSLQLTALSALLVAALAAAVLYALRSRLDPALWIPVAAALAGLPIYVWVTLFAQIGRSFGWPVVAYAPTQLLHPVLLIVFAWSAGGLFGLDATTVVLSSLVGLLVVLAVQLPFLGSRLVPSIRGTRPAYETGNWMAVALPLVLFEGFAILIAQTDLLLVGVWRSSAEVGAYAAAARIAMLVKFCFDAAASLAGPRFAALYAQQKLPELRALIRGLLPWIVVPALGVTVVLSSFADLLLDLFGPGFGAAQSALIVLAVGHCAAVLAGPAALILNMTGHHADTCRVLGGATLLNVVLNVAWIPPFGLVGAAWATVLSILLSRLVLRWLVRVRLGVESSVWALVREHGTSRSDP